MRFGARSRQVSVKSSRPGVAVLAQPRDHLAPHHHRRGPVGCARPPAAPRRAPRTRSRSACAQPRSASGLRRLSRVWPPGHRVASTHTLDLPSGCSEARVTPHPGLRHVCRRAHTQYLAPRPMTCRPESAQARRQPAAATGPRGGAGGRERAPAQLRDDPRRGGARGARQPLPAFRPQPRDAIQRRRRARDDLIQVASLGLVAALDRFDPERGVPFAAFAGPTILGELRRHFRDRVWTLARPARPPGTHPRVDGAIAKLSHELERSPTVAEIAELLDMTRPRCSRRSRRASRAARSRSTPLPQATSRRRGADDGADRRR